MPAASGSSTFEGLLRRLLQANSCNPFTKERRGGFAGGA
jgi:hypothetical protein